MWISEYVESNTKFQWREGREKTREKLCRLNWPELDNLDSKGVKYIARVVHLYIEGGKHDERASKHGKIVNKLKKFLNLSAKIRQVDKKI